MDGAGGCCCGATAPSIDDDGCCCASTGGIVSIAAAGVAKPVTIEATCATFWLVADASGDRLCMPLPVQPRSQSLVATDADAELALAVWPKPLPLFDWCGW